MEDCTLILIWENSDFKDLKDLMNFALVLERKRFVEKRKVKCSRKKRHKYCVSISKDENMEITIEVKIPPSHVARNREIHAPFKCNHLEEAYWEVANLGAKKPSRTAREKVWKKTAPLTFHFWIPCTQEIGGICSKTS
jgi:hypothetical protein